MVISFSSLSYVAKPLLLQFRNSLKISPKFPKTLCLITKMSSWECSKCTFINPPAQKSRCEICLSAPPPPLVLSSSSPPPESMWSCAACTFLNPYSSTVCQICDTRATATRRSTLEIDDDDLDNDVSIGGVFLPLKACSNVKKENSLVGGGDAGSSAELSARGDCDFGNGKSKYNVDIGGEKMGFSARLRPCSIKRKIREEDDVGVAGGSSQFRAAKSIAAGETPLCSESKTWKLLSYNIWFAEDVEVHKRMRAIGNLIELHSPDVMCFQEVTPNIYEIFQKSSWWKGYQCSVPDHTAVPGGYFCMQLSKLPVKSYSRKPFHNSIMGRELSVAEVEVMPGTTMVVATSHLESPCPSPPTYNQMFSKERVVQANEAVRLLEKNENVIFCGDMNWDDKKDGPFPLGDGWVDAWTELRPGEDGWTYDTKSNKMLSANYSLQKRLDRFICKLKKLKICKIEMIGRDEIAGATYTKVKKVKGQVKEFSLPVLPSDHFGLLLTISPT